MPRLTTTLAVLVGVLAPRGAAAKNADPATYTTVLPTLQPGETLNLAPGTYKRLNITNLNGTATAWITISGPSSGPAAVFEADACCNTVEIVKSSYVAIQNITVDGKKIDGAFGLSAKNGASNLVHHILVEGCTFINHDAGQQQVGISTKTPTWGWVIRRNRITGVGTGLYLGDSTGDSPFVGGIIENNLITDPIGYCLQIKWQKPRPTVPGMPTGPSVTIIRHNVLIKNDQPSPDGDRPNLLVGGFPDSGAGSQDRYEIYGNLIAHNPREALVQASGRVSIHDNILVDSAKPALVLQNHDLPLKLAHVYNNTIFDAPVGISFGNAASDGDAVVGNLVFAAAPLQGTIKDSRDNLSAAAATAGQYVTAPSKLVGQMDFYPLAGKCRGAPMDLSLLAQQTDYALDFNGQSKGTFTFRGAYAGEGKNPGWKLGADIKTVNVVPPADGPRADAAPRTDGKPAAADAPTSDGALRDSRPASGEGRPVTDGGGCGCDVASRRPLPAALLLLLFLGLGLCRLRRS